MCKVNVPLVKEGPHDGRCPVFPFDFLFASIFPIFSQVSFSLVTPKQRRRCLAEPIFTLPGPGPGTGDCVTFLSRAARRALLIKVLRRQQLGEAESFLSQVIMGTFLKLLLSPSIDLLANLVTCLLKPARYTLSPGCHQQG